MLRKMSEPMSEEEKVAKDRLAAHRRKLTEDGKIGSSKPTTSEGPDRASLADVPRESLPPEVRAILDARDKQTPKQTPTEAPSADVLALDLEPVATELQEPVSVPSVPVNRGADREGLTAQVIARIQKFDPHATLKAARMRCPEIGRFAKFPESLQRALERSHYGQCIDPAFVRAVVDFCVDKNQAIQLQSVTLTVIVLAFFSQVLAYILTSRIP